MSTSNPFRNRQPNVSLDSVSFDTSRYRFEGEADRQRIWVTPEGDGIGLLFFPRRPDLPAPARTSLELEDFYRGRVCNDEVKMVEFRLLPVASVASIWMILKISRGPDGKPGMTYIGSLTIPFAEFSFVVKMQCEERGITGIRETALFLKAKSEGNVTLGSDGKLMGDWNPDDARHDDKFPDHPVSRLRREFSLIVSSLQLQEATRNEKRFGLPDDAA